MTHNPELLPSELAHLHAGDGDAVMKGNGRKRTSSARNQDVGRSGKYANEHECEHLSKRH
jgi:hypothetical protein